MGLSDSVGLLFTIKSDSTQAKSDIKEFGDTGENALTSFASKLGLTTEQAAMLGKALPIAAAGIAGIAAAAVGAGAALFAMAKQASDFGSEIFDASKKTGLSAETLSSLKFAADQSGSSLEAVSGSVTKFSRLIGEAEEGSKKAKESLIRLGLDPKTAINDLDGSLAKVFQSIQDAENPIIKTKLATEAFGRSGQDILPVLDSFDGNLKALIEDCKRLGVTITDEAAAQADGFGDALDRNSAQIKGVANQIGFALIPQINELASTFSDFLTANKTDIISWAQTVISWTSKAINNVRLWRALFADQGDPNSARGNFRRVQQEISDEEQRRQDEKATADVERMLAERRRTKLPGGGLTDFKDAEDAKKEAEKRQKEREAAFKQQVDLLKRYNALEIEAARQKFEETARLNEGNIEATLKALEEMRIQVLNLLSESQRIAIVGKTGQELKNLQLEYKNAVEKFNSDINSQKAEFNKKQLDADKKLSEEQIRLAEKTAERRMELDKSSSATRLIQLKDDLENRRITEIEYVLAVEKIQIGALEREKEILNEELKGLDKKSDKYAEITQKIKLLDDELTQTRIDNAQKVREATSAGDVFTPPNMGEEGIPDPTTAPPGIFDGWTESWKKFVAAIEGSVGIGNIITGISDLAIGAMQGMARAVGSAIEGWALYGDSIGTALRKALAAELAHIAGVAAINAIYATALGFLRLAQWDFDGAANAFISAGIWAAIAGVAAISAKAIAPQAKAQQSFNSQTSQATGSRSSGGGRVYSGYGDDASVINIGRNAPTQPQQVQVTFKEKSGWFSEMFLIEVRKNGLLRDELRDIAATG